MSNETQNKGGSSKVFRQGSNESNCEIKSNISHFFIFFLLISCCTKLNFFYQFVAAENFSAENCGPQFASISSQP